MYTTCSGATHIKEASSPTISKSSYEIVLIEDLIDSSVSLCQEGSWSSKIDFSGKINTHSCSIGGIPRRKKKEKIK